MILDITDSRQNQLRDAIKSKSSDWQVICYNTAFSLVTAVYDDYKGDIDLLFIYIEDKSDKNISMAREIQGYFPHIRIIFYSGRNDCAEEIFSARPMYFLTVPLKKEKLYEALGRIEYAIKTEKNRTITIIANSRKQTLKYDSISYIESFGRKEIFYTDDGPFETYMTADSCQALLPSTFVRCHRSYIINVDRVESCESSEIVLANGISVPVSRTYIKEVRHKLLKG